MLEWVVADCAPGVTLRLVASPAGLRAIDFHLDQPPTGNPVRGNPVLDEAVAQLRAYFASELRAFNLPLDPQGSDFQRRVWRQLETIPYGEIRSYLQVAEAIRAPKAVRAVGAANGSNPIPIVIPCHRVIGSNGKLVGYGGGLPLKRRLLALESGNSALFHV